LAEGRLGKGINRTAYNHQDNSVASKTEQGGKTQLKYSRGNNAQVTWITLTRTHEEELSQDEKHCVHNS